MPKRSKYTDELYARLEIDYPLDMTELKIDQLIRLATLEQLKRIADAAEKRK